MKEKYIVINNITVCNYVVIISIEKSLPIKKYYDKLSKIRYSFKVEENNGV